MVAKMPLFMIWYLREGALIKEECQRKYISWSEHGVY